MISPLKTPRVKWVFQSFPMIFAFKFSVSWIKTHPQCPKSRESPPASDTLTWTDSNPDVRGGGRFPVRNIKRVTVSIGLSIDITWRNNGSTTSTSAACSLVPVRMKTNHGANMNLLLNDVKLCSFQMLTNQHHFKGFDMNFRKVNSDWGSSQNAGGFALPKFINGHWNQNWRYLPYK